MKILIKLGQKIEECRKHIFNQDYSYDEADKYVKLVFEETGLKFGVFDDIEKSDIIDAINYLDKEILK
tara:strand:- start:178 stop:381 length:204 start_codon:yes stop_codon:yes gene_type:complete